MNKISVHIIQEPAESPVRMANLAARLTQSKIKSIEELRALMKYDPKLIQNIYDMKHESVVRHSNWTIAVIGASRRFLAQIRTHSVGISGWISASLQYSDMRNDFDAVVPYPVIEKAVTNNDYGVYSDYINKCKQSFNNYKDMIELQMYDNDTAGYASCNSSRNAVVFTANTEALRNMINKRSCNRNTLETQYVMLLIWQTLIASAYEGEEMFLSAGPDCRLLGKCTQKKMSCGEPWSQELYKPYIAISKRFGAIKKFNTMFKEGTNNLK